MLSLSILSIASLMLSSAALAGKRRTHKTPVGRSCFLLRQLRNVAQNLKQRRGEGAVFLLLDAVEKGLEPRVHHRPYPLGRCSPLLGDRDVADAHVLRPPLTPHEPSRFENVERAA